MAVQVVERLVGDDAGADIHDVAFGNRFRFGVAVEWRAEQVESGWRWRGGERDEKLIAIMLANDFGDLFLGVLLRRLRVWLV